MIPESQPPLFERLRATLSAERLGTYLTAAGFDPDRALRLYLWNAQVGEAFHLPIQGVEVALRNRVHAALQASFGPEWWMSPGFACLADEICMADLSAAFRRIRRRGRPIAPGQVVATLSFGFWVAMLRRRWNTMWTARFTAAFPHLPRGTRLQDLERRARQVAELRNRIWHHEPVFRMDLSLEFKAVTELLGWLCPVQAAWLRPLCHVPNLLRQKP
jgi:hypothetical protein